jgi:hypothetical protein
MIRPGRVLKGLSLLLAAVLAAAISLGLGVCSLRDRRWAALEARVAELTPGPGTPPLVRVPLGRTLVPGNAWDDYFRIGSGSISKFLPANLTQLLDEAGPEELKSLIDRNAVPIELLRSGVRRETARTPLPTEPPGHNPILAYHGLPIRELALVSIARARSLAASGNLREALELLLDVYLCGRDFAGTRRMNVEGWGLKPMESALREILEISGKLDPPMLRDLERQLAVLDEYFPDTSGEILDALLHLGELYVQEDEDDEARLNFAEARVRRHWRYFYSPRLEAASSFARGDALVREALAKKDLSWAAAESAIGDLESKLESLHDPVLDYFLHLHLETFRARNTRTYLRMVRIAVHYRATGAVQTLDNEQGGRIGTQFSKDSLQISNELAPAAIFRASSP